MKKILLLLFNFAYGIGSVMVIGRMLYGKKENINKRHGNVVKNTASAEGGVMNKKSITRRKGVEYGGDDAQATDHSLMEEWSRDPQQRVARLQKTGILEGLTFLQGCEIIGESTNGNNPSFIDPEKEGDIFYFDPEDIPYTPYSYAFSLHDGKGIAYETRSGRTLYLLRSDEVEGEWQLDCRNWWNESTNFKETVLVASLHILGGEV